MELKIDHVHVHSSRLEKTLEFFEKVLGGRLVLDTMLGGNRLVRVAVGDFVNVFNRPPGVEAQNPSTPASTTSPSGSRTSTKS